MTLKQLLMSGFRKTGEEVVKVINQVCYKKSDGKFFIMAERIAWMPNTCEQFKISLGYKNISIQRISADNKDKIQIQLLTYSNKSHTFQFVDSGGKDQQLRLRNEVKNHLALVLPQFKERFSNELSDKKLFFELNADAFQQYKNLVAEKYIIADDFWRRVESSGDLTLSLKKCSRGPPSDILLECDDSLRYNYKLKEEILHVYPGVREMYDAEEDKEQFWKKFLRSHYHYRRHRVDIFSHSDKIDIEECQRYKEHLRRYYEHDCVADPDFEDDSNLPAHDLGIRFNRNNFMLLQSLDRRQYGRKRPSREEESGASNSKRRLLEATKDSFIREDTSCQGVPFNVELVAKNQGVRSSMQQGDHGPDSDARKRLKKLKRSLARMSNGNFLRSMDSSVNTETLANLGHQLDGGRPRPADSKDSPASRQLEAIIKILYRSVSDLLRHFWDCFPITDAAGFEKIHRMKDSLKKFKEEKIEKFAKEHLNYYILTGSMEMKPTCHLSEMVDRALEAYHRYIDNYNTMNKTKELQSS